MPRFSTGHAAGPMDLSLPRAFCYDRSSSFTARTTVIPKNHSVIFLSPLIKLHKPDKRTFHLFEETINRVQVSKLSSVFI